MIAILTGALAGLACYIGLTVIGDQEHRAPWKAIALYWACVTAYWLTRAIGG